MKATFTRMLFYLPLDKGYQPQGGIKLLKQEEPQYLPESQLHGSCHNVKEKKHPSASVSKFHPSLCGVQTKRVLKVVTQNAACTPSPCGALECPATTLYKSRHQWQNKGIWHGEHQRGLVRNIEGKAKK